MYEQTIGRYSFFLYTKIETKKIFFDNLLLNQRLFINELVNN